MSMSSLSSASRFAPPPTQARPALQASGPASVVQNQRTGVRIPGRYGAKAKDWLKWTEDGLTNELGIQLRAIVRKPEITLPNEWFLSEERMQGVADRVNLLAKKYGQKVSDQLRQVLNTRGTNNLELSREGSTFSVVNPLWLYDPERVHLRTVEPFSHQKRQIVDHGERYAINTCLPVPYSRDPYCLGNQKPHLNTEAPGFWQELTSLLLPESPALTIPKELLTYPHLSKKELGLLQRSEISLNRAVIDDAQIKKVREKVGL
jgi:hypothetical protein